MDKVSTCLWFDTQAKEAADFYCGLIPNSRIVSVTNAPADYPSGKAGQVLEVTFELAGKSFIAMNGGPYFKFTEATSLSIDCKDQAEVDRLWQALSAVPDAEQCGWVKDRYGLSWQIIPEALPRLLCDPDRARAKRVMEAMMGMKKLDVAALETAAAG